MRIFNKYKDNKGKFKVNQTLLWDFDLETLNWQKHKATIVKRVIEFGRLSDFFAIFDLYGGINSVANIARNEVVDLSERDLQFMCQAFNLKKEETKCYEQRLLREKHLNS